MPAATRTRLEDLDAALTRLRRLWETPVLRQRLLELIGDEVEFSLIRALRAIELTGLSEPGVGDVAMVLGVDDSTASRLIDHAVNAGTVERTISTRDRRRCVLRLTEDGKDVLRGALRARTTLLREATSTWEPSDVATLTELLDRFTSAVTGTEQSA